MGLRKTFEPGPSELGELQRIARTLKESNQQIAAATKYVEAAKAGLAKWLKDRRQCDVETLGAGDLIEVKGVVLLEVQETTRFDEKGFAVAQPVMFEKWRKPTARKVWKPLAE